MRKLSHTFLGLLLPVSSLVACATSPTDDADDNAGLETGAPKSPTAQDPDSTSVQAADDALLAQVEFGDPVYNGSGCVQGTGSIELSADHRTLTLNTPATFAATTGGDLVDIRKFCETAVAVSPPAGIRLGIARVDFDGSAVITGRGEGSVTINKRFPSGDEDATRVVVNKSGALDLVTDPGVTWSGCGQATIAIASVALLASDANADLKGSQFTSTFVAERCR